MNAVTKNQTRNDSDSASINVISTALALVYGVGLATLGCVAWQFPACRLMSATGMGLLLALFLVQLFRFRSTYPVIEAGAKENLNVATVLNATKGLFLLGVLLFFVLANLAYLAFARSGR